MKIVKQAFLGILIFLVIVLLGSLGGYAKGMRDRKNYQDLVIATEAFEQLFRAEVDFQTGNYAQAIARLEYIIQLDPEYPGAVDLLSKALFELNKPTSTPTLTPTSTPTPTPETADLDAMFQQALQFNEAEDWDNLILKLDEIRFEDLSFKTAEINNLYYNAYRFRGIKLILAGSLEPGIFDINTAEKFGTLDIQAINFRQWAEWYVTGASFWGVDWVQAITYFKYLLPHVPNLMDSTYLTVQNRLGTAEVIYPTEAVSRAENYLNNSMYCEAYYILQYVSDNYGPLSPEYSDPYLIARDKCWQQIGSPTPTP